jgi:hypothetical protein
MFYGFNVAYGQPIVKLLFKGRNVKTARLLFRFNDNSMAVGIIVKVFLFFSASSTHAVLKGLGGYWET